MTHGKTIQINNTQLYYEEYGEGKPLLLLHGFGGSSQNWAPFIDDLQKEYRLIVVDLRGHGHSTNPYKHFTHHQAAKDVILLLEKLEIKHCSAMGISSGGMTLLHIATINPKLIDAMVLISATTHFPDQARAIMRRVSYDTMPPQVKQMYQECATRGEEQIRELISQFNAFSENYDDMNFKSEDLSVITAKTLVIHGDRDQFFPIEIPVNIYQSIPNSALWIIPEGSHVPIDDPKVPFTETALRFLNQS